jgi:outer membrane protein
MPGQEPSTRRGRCTELLRRVCAAALFCGASFALAGASFTAAAADLLQVYRDAREYDAQYAAARHALEAGRERLAQGRALTRPAIGLSGSATRQRLESDSRDPSRVPSFTRTPDAIGYTLTFSQPIYRPQNWIQYDQALVQVRQAEALYEQAGQDLILRVAQAYFDVLAAHDTLELVRAQKAAISEQLAAAKRNFEVGTATITDTHEAQARFDLIEAQEIAAQNELENRRRGLQLLTGKEYAELRPLRAQVRLAPPNPPEMQSWVELAERQAYPVRIQQAVTEIAALEARRASAAHLPTLDLVATHGQSAQSATSVSPVGIDLTSTTLGLQLALPLYAGGAITSREREAAALSSRAREELENARRSTALATRQSYLTVINGIAQIGALDQALISSQSALDSNKLGYEVGVRINIDVLNAQQQLFSTRRDLALARYATITSHLRLKAAAGSLREEDLEEVNRALSP